MSARQQKVIVAMSGGVDSSTAAFLLQKEGYELVGMFMRLENASAEAEAAAEMIVESLLSMLALT